MSVLFCDYETRSTVNLKLVGAHKYAAHPSTQVLCAAYAIDEGPVLIWTPGDPVPPEFTAAATDPDWTVSAFNDAFERVIEEHILALRYGFPVIPVDRHRCTMAAARALALPGSLGGVAHALGLEQQKDDSGRTLMMQMCRPRKPRKDEDPNGTYWFDDLDRRSRLYAYCKQDVVTERAVYGRIGGLSDTEQAVWTLDAAINARGMHLDVGLITAAIEIGKAAAAAIDVELAQITAGASQLRETK